MDDYFNISTWEATTWMIFSYRDDGSIIVAEWDEDAQAFVFPEPL